MLDELNENKKYIARQKRLRSYSVITTVIAVIALTAATFAWFAMNKKVDSDGMVMQARTVASMVIGITPEQVAAYELGDSAYQVDLSGVYEDLDPILPCRHKDANFTEDTDTGLYYNVNSDAVSYTEGLAKGADEELRFKAVPIYKDTDANRYYLDYVVYVASLTDELPRQDMFAEIASTDKVGELEETYNACSIDFYVGEEETYFGTLNVAGYDWEANNQSEFTKVTLAEDVTIPYNKAESDANIKITMRCYFDGGLKSSATHAFINSDTIQVDKIALSIKFSAAEHEAETE